MPIGYHLLPPRFSQFYGKRRNTQFTMFDVGCGNHSPSLTKHWFPQCRYIGLDREAYNNDERDFAAMEQFIKADLTLETLAGIEDSSFDVIMLVHVLEHLPKAEGVSVLASLCRKLKPRGDFYIEFPSARSLTLPSGIGTLNFYDDATHVHLPDPAQVRGVVEENGIRVVRAGGRRNWPRLLLSPLSLPLQAYTLFRYRKLYAPMLWDLVGFADFVYGEKWA